MNLLYKILFTTTLVLTSCEKSETSCEPENTKCSENIPTNELCQAFFTRWFFDKNTNTCSQKSYSGWGQKGFETKEECENCKCK